MAMTEAARCSSELTPRRIPFVSDLIVHTIICIGAYIGYRSVVEGSDVQSYHTQLSLFIMCYYEGIYWSFVVVTGLLDTRTSSAFKRRHKLLGPELSRSSDSSNTKKEVPRWTTKAGFRQMASVTARNQFFQAFFLFGTLRFIQVIQNSWIMKYLASLTHVLFGIEQTDGADRPQEHSFFFFIASLLFLFLVFDVVFWSGHKLLHDVPYLARNVHRTHHSTYATAGVSGHFMDWWDFWFESVWPIMIGALVGFAFDLSHVSFVCVMGMGAFNTVWSHSGWDFEGFPSPIPHFLHHKKHRVNYGIGPMDVLFRTHSK